MKKIALFIVLSLFSQIACAGVSQAIIKGTLIAVVDNKETIVIKSGNTKFFLKNSFNKDFSDIGCKDYFQISKDFLIKKEKINSSKKIKYKCNK